MKLADHYKWTGPIEELQKQWTNREYLVRLKHLEEQVNHPSRSDYYIMRLTWTVANLLAKNSPNKIDLKPYELKFSFGSKENVDLTPEEKQAKLDYHVAMQKAVWAARLGGAKVRKTEGGH